MEQVEFIEPGVHTRRHLLILYVTVVLVGAVLVSIAQPALLAFIKGLPVCEQARRLLWLLVAVLAPLPVVAGWAIVHARKLLQFNRSPLPNAWVWRRTPIRRGRPVRIQAYALVVLAVLLLLAPLYGWYVLQPVWSALYRHCGA